MMFILFPNSMSTCTLTLFVEEKKGGGGEIGGSTSRTDDGHSRPSFRMEWILKLFIISAYKPPIIPERG